MTRRSPRISPSRRRALSIRRLFAESLEPRFLLSWTGPVANPPIDSTSFFSQRISSDQITARAATRDFVDGELIVAVEVPVSQDLLPTFLSALHWETRLGIEGTVDTRPLLQFESQVGRTVAVVSLDLQGGSTLAALPRFDDDPFVLWTSPNFVYPIDPREFTPDDPRFASQYAHSLSQTDLAWDMTWGDSWVVIGVTDDGIDLDHEDLAANIWQNSGEIPQNGIDDDANGYVDDVAGWDFVDDDNDANPNGFDQHGTHVAGIAAAEIDNARGVAGVAGGSTILPLKIYDGAQPGAWTSAVVAEAFAYAADNGANIVTTSYNIDPFAGDPVFTAGLQYLYDADVLHFNSAGNANTKNPPRQAFEQSILVANTNQYDRKFSSSNYGDGIDLTAPGVQIVSTMPGSNYGSLTGTSMATPNAAGAAALIWSANPTWTRDQVAAQLLATADNIDLLNPNYAGQLGAGRVNPFRALTETPGPPMVEHLAGLPADGGGTDSPLIGEFSLSFTQFMNAAAINGLQGLELRGAGLDGLFDTADDRVVGLSLVSQYMAGSNAVRVAITDGPLALGAYRLTIAASQFTNPFGTELDGDQDGLAGGDFVTSFSVNTSPPLARQPWGGLVYQSTVPGAIWSPTEVDRYPLSLDAGTAFSVQVQGDGDFVPEIELLDPAGSSLGVIDANGNTALLPSGTAAMAGDYLLLVREATGGPGSYVVDWFLHAQAEEEATGTGTNDQASGAEPLAASRESWGTHGAARMATVGSLSANDEDWFVFSLNDGDHASIVVGSGSPLSMELQSSSGSVLTTATEVSSGVYIASYQDLTADGMADDYFVRIDQGVGEYTLVVTEQAAFELESGDAVGAAGQILLSNAVFGFVADHGNGQAEPDEQVQGTVVDMAFPGVLLSTSSGGHVYVDAGSFQAPTGNLVFAPYPGSASGWSDGANELRIDFLQPTNFVSIDVGSDDQADIGYLRAYDRHGVLVAEVVSEAVPNGGFQTLSISRPLADIAYALSAGLGSDITPLDHLRFSNPGGSDIYAIDVNAGDQLELMAYLPGEGPNDLINGLDTPLGRQLVLELLDPAGTSLGTSSDILQHVATEAGRYTLAVTSLSGQGEYFVEVIGATGNDFRPYAVGASVTDEERVLGFPSSIRIDFSEPISVTSLAGNELLVNGVPSTSAGIMDTDSIEFFLDPQVYAGRGTYEAWLPADSLADVDGRGNLDFNIRFTVEEVLPFVRVGIPGTLATASRGNQIRLDLSEMEASVSFDASAGDRVVGAIFPQNPQATLTASVLGQVESITAEGPGIPIYLPAATLTHDGELTIQLRSDLPTTTTLDIYRNTELISGQLTGPNILADGFPVVGGYRYAVLAELPETGPAAAEFDIALPAGATASVDVLLRGTHGPVSESLILELLDAEGEVVANADDSTNGQFERAFLGHAWPGSAAYRLRVSGEGGEVFQLVILADTVIELEPNGPSDPPRELARRADNSAGAMGFLEVDDIDAFSIHLDAGQLLSLRTNTFADGAYDNPTNLLDPRLRLLSPDGLEVAFDADGLDGKNATLEFAAGVAGTYRIEISADSGHGEYGLAVGVLTPPSGVGDFDGDGLWNCRDIDLLIANLAAGEADFSFDLNNDGIVDLHDRDAWLQIAAAQNGLPASYLVGDANLDGVVDTSDFNLWNVHKFTATAAWCSGDFNADGLVDTSDFNLWNINKYTETAAALRNGTVTGSASPLAAAAWSVGEPTLALPPSPAVVPGKTASNQRSVRRLWDDTEEKQWKVQATDWLLAELQW